MGTSINHSLGPTDDASFVGGQSEAVQRLNAIVGQIARTEIAVLLVGESGSGKETYAHLIHRLSEQRDAPLQKLSCAAWEPGQLLSRLKAHLQTQPGDGVGVVKTLYLDGIDELDLASQKVLLSLLRDGDGSGVGKSRLRLISSASQELRAEVESGRFRRDLYFRINGVCLRLPPLRERKEDIPALVEHFLAKHSRELRRHTPVLGSQEVELLIAHDWPGNIRELANLVQKMVALGNPTMAVADLATTGRAARSAPKASQTFSLKAAARAASRQAERELILKALEQTRWNRKRAAQELKISYKSLLYKIKQTGVEGEKASE
jgi:two-component system response regulator AtoC